MRPDVARVALSEGWPLQEDWKSFDALRPHGGIKHRMQKRDKAVLGHIRSEYGTGPEGFGFDLDRVADATGVPREHLDSMVDRGMIESVSGGSVHRLAKAQERPGWREKAAQGMAMHTALAHAHVEESKKTAMLSTTHAPIGKGGRNWVTASKPGNTGQLPAYIQNIRNALIRDGKDESHATAIAIATVKRWASGVGNVHAEVRAAAAKAVAEWEKMKGEAHAKSAVKKAAS